MLVASNRVSGQLHAGDRVCGASSLDKRGRGGRLPFPQGHQKSSTDGYRSSKGSRKHEREARGH